MSGIFLTYTWYGKWVDIFQVYVGIFQTYRPSGQPEIYGIFQEYVRIMISESNFYGFQMLKYIGVSYPSIVCTSTYRYAIHVVLAESAASGRLRYYDIIV